MPLALALLLLAAGWRVAAVLEPALVNFSPVMALAFCGAVYFSSRRLWLVPLAALVLSDLYLDYYYAARFGETWSWPGEALRAACFACALPIGRLVARHKNWLTLATGALGASLLFYLVTNTEAWFRDPFYVKTAAGWWQALTLGRPEFPPTLLFFRNTLLSDLLFTGMFALTMEIAALRAGRPTLIAKRVSS